MNDGNAKQQIVEKIKNSSNILVTVSTDPSVDELSAALGLTVLLNNMNKHATAVFSGAVPAAINFLDPQKTFENTVDSLRDFIIALDKEKADHLRYKVEGEVVKIFITPYRTTITSDDLEFSQGDYNVELVLALGVKQKENLDDALTAHGRILHDATVATISVGDMKSELGSVNWREENASSLSEVLVSLSESLKTDKTLLDEQIATAFLTGIVAATDRFSNNHTSSRVMTMAAQLMAAGANQQLIASKLEEAHEIGQDAPITKDEALHSDGTTDLSEGQSTKLDKAAGDTATAAVTPNDGSLSISHQANDGHDDNATPTQAAPTQTTEDELEKRSQEVIAQQQDEAAQVAEQNLATQLSSVLPPVASTGGLSVADLQKDLASASAEVEDAAAQPAIDTQAAPLSGAVSPSSWQHDDTPSMGGVLNATTEQAADDQRKLEDDDRNHTLLSHTNTEYIGDAMPTFQSPINATSLPSDEPSMTDPFASSSASTVVPPVAPITPVTSAAPAPTLAELDEQNRQPHEEARAAVDAAFGAVPFTPSSAPAINQPGDVSVPHAIPDLPPLPPLPDFSTLPPLPSLTNFDDTNNSLPPEKLEDMFAPAPPTETPPPKPNDPGQFKIPGQQ
jgi:hypothetical protein